MISQPFVLLMSPQPGQNPIMSFLPIIAIFVVFYFFMIRPQMKRQKEAQKFRAELKSGDKIITTGGIYGKIVEVDEKTAIIEVEGKNRLKIDKAGLLRDGSDISKAV